MLVPGSSEYERGAAHVSGNHVAIAHEIADEARSDDASGRTALDHADCPFSGFRRGQQTAIALHHHDRPVVTAFRQYPLKI